MEDLKSMFSDMEFKNISIYIQSGNILFTTNEKDENILSGKIASQIQKIFGYNISVVLKNGIDFQHIVSHNPFYTDSKNMKRLHLTFLSDLPDKNNLNELGSSVSNNKDHFIVKGQEIYIDCEGMYHQSKWSNQFFEKKLKVSCATRNWKTVLKLYEISKSISLNKEN